MSSGTTVSAHLPKHKAAYQLAVGLRLLPLGGIVNHCGQPVTVDYLTVPAVSVVAMIYCAGDRLFRCVIASLRKIAFRVGQL